ncbi:YxeA family protein [Lacticaseibacillus baoqingensis]|uniref:YxeA family protein n=1 Tax=Lacticaseibacillus baoqingensis TaxID=2486013 RepID=A0ABW4E8Y9_9LACO|nr:YxeA family protein [Lacticaseibacillus baoqingensis]
MKKIISFCLIVGLMIGGGCVAAKWATANSASDAAALVDAINPLVPTQTVYVKTCAPQQVDAHGTATYQQSAYAADGHTRPIVFTGMRVLKQGHYLALTTKGAYVKTYTEVAKRDIPTPVLNVIDRH